MDFVVIIEEGDNSWGAHVPDLPGCIAVAETRGEALELIREAISFHLEGLKESGMPVPTGRTRVELVHIEA